MTTNLLIALLALTALALTVLRAFRRRWIVIVRGTRQENAWYAETFGPYGRAAAASVADAIRKERVAWAGLEVTVLPLKRMAADPELFGRTLAGLNGLPPASDDGRVRLRA